MNNRYRRVYEMVLRVISFLKANLDFFNSIAVVQNYLDNLENNAAKLSQLGVDKVNTTETARGATLSRGDLRDTLRDSLRNISQMWKSMADELDNTTYKFRMPHGGTDQNLVATARNFLTEATPLKTEFTQRGMPADFLEDLAKYTDDFAEAINESEDAYRERVGVNAAFIEPGRECTKLVSKLDPIVRMVFRNNPQKSAEWLVASHLERASHTPKEKIPAEEKQ